MGKIQDYFRSMPESEKQEIRDLYLNHNGIRKIQEILVQRIKSPDDVTYYSKPHPNYIKAILESGGITLRDPHERTISAHIKRHENSRSYNLLKLKNKIRKIEKSLDFNEKLLQKICKNIESGSKELSKYINLFLILENKI